MTWAVEELRDGVWVQIALFATREDALECVDIERRFGGRFRTRKV